MKLPKYVVGVGSSRFQLQYMSQYLIKEERDDPDPRVQHFIPDTWQVLAHTANSTLLCSNFGKIVCTL